MIYEWKNNSRFTVNAQVAGEHIEQLQKDNGDVITPQILVNANESEKSPLHNCFEWDNSKAANEHRKAQARKIINSIRVVIEGEGDNTVTTRAHLHVIGEEDTPNYMSSARVMSDEQLRKQVLQQAWNEVQIWKKRYEELNELAQIHQAIDDAEASISI